MDNLNEMARFLILPFLVYWAIISVLTFVVFAWDKFQSARGGWRVPEKTLLLLAIIGGSPAILLGQKYLRHKTRKQPFKTYLLVIVLIQIITAIVFSFYTFNAN